MSALTDEQAAHLRHAGRVILREPFTKRAWSELLFLTLGAWLAVVGLEVVLLTLSVGVALAITFFGLAILALSVRTASRIGRLQRRLARSLIGETIEEPDAFVRRPGFLGWLQSAVRDRTGWRALAYLLVKVPLSAASVYVAWSIWWDAIACLSYPLWRHSSPAVFGIVPNVFRPGYLSVGTTGFLHASAIVITGLILLFVAPWATRLVIAIDRPLMRALLAPDATSLRLRSLEQARAQTVDASAATLRRIERDLHDGTQAQLVALAMQLGMAKEKLSSSSSPDLAQVRALVDDAHALAKEAIVELRDLARGIHPPALDVGLEGALSTLASRSTVPTELTVAVADRPTPAIEAIAYFCVAELLANVAQHAKASRASVSCVQDGQWLRVVVRDDGVGGAALPSAGSSSSGLVGLVDRVRSVDGRLSIVSPEGGPTVVTADLPLHA